MFLFFLLQLTSGAEFIDLSALHRVEIHREERIIERHLGIAGDVEGLRNCPIGSSRCGRSRWRRAGGGVAPTEKTVAFAQVVTARMVDWVCARWNVTC